jgi:hypothetical protein
MSTVRTTLESRWQEVGIEGVRPALGGPEYLVSRFKEYVQEGLLNVYHYEINKGRAQRQEISYLEREVERAGWDNTGSSAHQHMMAVVCWHIANELGREYVLGGEYPVGAQYSDVADRRFLLPCEVGSYGEDVKLETLLQAGAFSRSTKYNRPTPNGVGRVAFVPYPEEKSTVKEPGVTFPVYVFTKEWMTNM